MLQSIYATKIGMTQAWTAGGKRLPVTKCHAEKMSVVSVREVSITDTSTLKKTQHKVKQVQLGLGTKKLAKMSKPLRSYLTTQGFSDGIASIKTSYLTDESTQLTPGATLALSDLLAVGDVVQVQGTSKGSGYTGVVKRYGFAGGPATHGQSDRERAPGSIGMRTTPGRVHKNKRMAGHAGVEAVTVLNLVIVHIDNDTGEIWLSGPVPGSIASHIKITKTGRSKKIDINHVASNLQQSTNMTKSEDSVDLQATDKIETADSADSEATSAEVPEASKEQSESTSENEKIVETEKQVA